MMCNWRKKCNNKFIFTADSCVWKCHLVLLEPFVENLCQKNPGNVCRRTKCSVCWWALGDRAFVHRVRAWLGPNTGLWWRGGRALPTPQICERWQRWYKTNLGLVIFGWPSEKEKSVPSADSNSQLTSHFGHNTDLIRDKRSRAKSSRCFCRLVWQAWLLHCFICLWYSHHSGTARLISHTTWHSLQGNGTFLWFVLKITPLSLKAAELLGVGVLRSFFFFFF